jgi:hypothetical protein
MLLANSHIVLPPGEQLWWKTYKTALSFCFGRKHTTDQLDKTILGHKFQTPKSLCLKFEVDTYSHNTVVQSRLGLSQNYGKQYFTKRTKFRRNYPSQ